ncbi:MAG: hypothetical protein Q9M28_11475 [Mariprofundaceae bacterium]|nr:hypothetical protein [Mariprofundaceae bacterium]
MSEFTMPNIEEILSILKKYKATVVDIKTFSAYLDGVSFAEIARQQGLGRAATQARVSRLRNRSLDEVSRYLDQTMVVRHACIRRATAEDERLERLLHLFHYDENFRPIIIGNFVLNHRQFRNKKKVELILARVVFSFLRMSKIRSFGYAIREKDMANVLRSRFSVASNRQNDALLSELFAMIACQKYATVLFPFQGSFFLTSPITSKLLDEMFLLGNAFSFQTLFTQFSKLSDSSGDLFSDISMFRAYLQACIDQQDSLFKRYDYDDEKLFLKIPILFSETLKQSDLPAVMFCMYEHADVAQHAIGSSPDIDFMLLLKCIATHSNRSSATVERSLRQSPLLLHLGYGHYTSLRQEALA